MRFVLVTLLVLLSGCGRWLGLAAARRDVVSETLQAMRFPVGAEEATLRLRGQLAVTTRCDRFASDFPWCERL